MFVVDLLDPAVIGVLPTEEVPEAISLCGEGPVSPCVHEVGYMSASASAAALIAEKEENGNC